MSHLDLSDEEKTRREKLKAYREKSVNPYRNGLTPKFSVEQIRKKWGELAKEQLEAEKPQVTYAGRIMAFRQSFDQRSQRSSATGTEPIRRWFGRPPFGGRPHLESPSTSCPSLCRSSRSSEAMDCISVRSGPPQLVGIAAFRDRVSVDVLVGSARFRPAGLATTLWVPAIRRLCRPMIGS